MGETLVVTYNLEVAIELYCSGFIASYKGSVHMLA
jgi:hypothetical protein